MKRDTFSRPPPPQPTHPTPRLPIRYDIGRPVSVCLSVFRFSCLTQTKQQTDRYGTQTLGDGTAVGLFLPSNWLSCLGATKALYLSGRSAPLPFTVRLSVYTSCASSHSLSRLASLLASLVSYHLLPADRQTDRQTDRVTNRPTDDRPATPKIDNWVVS